VGCIKEAKTLGKRTGESEEKKERSKQNIATGQFRMEENKASCKENKKRKKEVENARKGPKFCTSAGEG